MKTMQHFAGRSLYSEAIKRWAVASVLAMLSAIGATSWVALTFVQEDVEFVSAELDGVGVLEHWVPVSFERQSDAMKELAAAASRNTAQPPLGREALQAAVASLQQHLQVTGDPLHFRPLLQDFLSSRTQWRVEGAGSLADGLPMSRTVFREISERSNLVLDGELQTYALMEALMLTLPQIQDDFVLLWAQAIHASAGAEPLADARLAEVQSASSGLLRRTEELRRYLLSTRGNTDLATIENLPLAELDAFERLVLAMEKVVQQRLSPPSPDVLSVGMEATTHLKAFYTSLMPRLASQLEQRAAALEKSQWLVMACIGLSLLCVVAAFFGVRRAARQHLAELGHMHSQLRIAACAFETSDGMLVLDAQGTVRQVNPAFVAMTGHPPAKLIGKTLAELDTDGSGQVSWLAVWESAKELGYVERELPLVAADGDVRQIWLRVSTVQDESGLTIAYVAVMTDRTRQLATDQAIRLLESQDPLTLLPNRRLFMESLETHLADIQGQPGVSGAVLFLDLDGFQVINDVAGHQVGDQLLREVGNRLSHVAQGNALVARLGGDEFGFLLTTAHLIGDTAEQATKVAMDCLAAVNKRMDLDGSQNVTASVGVTLTSHKDTVVDVIRRADFAVYAAKSAGRNTFRFFDAQSQANLVHRSQLMADLRNAVQLNQFVVWYQPQVTDEGRWVGMEALVRWQHPVHGLIPPATFIPLAEESGVIYQLGRWVLRTACQQLVAWSADPQRELLTVSVNVSGRELQQADYVERVVEILQSTGVNPLWLKLELTESMFVGDIDGIIEKMQALRAQGIGLSVDCFGTGYSSFSYLRRLPIDEIKLDKSFLDGALANPKAAALVKSIISVGLDMGLQVVAEGVETVAERNFLKANGCREFQGYLFGRPGPADQAAPAFTVLTDTSAFRQDTQQPAVQGVSSSTSGQLAQR